MDTIDGINASPYDGRAAVAVECPGDYHILALPAHEVLKSAHYQPYERFTRCLSTPPGQVSPPSARRDEVVPGEGEQRVQERPTS